MFSSSCKQTYFALLSSVYLFIVRSDKHLIIFLPIFPIVNQKSESLFRRTIRWSALQWSNADSRSTRLPSADQQIIRQIIWTEISAVIVCLTSGWLQTGKHLPNFRQFCLLPSNWWLIRRLYWYDWYDWSTTLGVFIVISHFIYFFDNLRTQCNKRWIVWVSVWMSVWMSIVETLVCVLYWTRV